MRIAFDPATPITDETYRACSTLARTSDQALIGTAAPAAQAWLLVEEPGPWGKEVASRDARLAPWLREELAARSLRFQWIRRHDRARSRGPHRSVIACWSDRAGSWSETFSWDRELEDLDLGALSRLEEGRRPHLGTLTSEPVVLVCTHGGVDPCCAKYGRSIAATLSDRFGPLVWETTHVGGCRYAANVLCLPTGVVYGHSDPELAVLQVEALLEGRLIDQGLRGHGGVPAPAQVAELEIRRRIDVWDIDAVEVSHRKVADDYVVRVEAAGDAYEVTVAPVPLPEQPYGCGHQGRWSPKTWEVTAIVPTPEGAASAT